MNIGVSTTTGLGVAILLLFLLLIVNAVWFYFSHSKSINKKLFGKPENFGFLFSSMILFADWAIYCISKKRAERAGVQEVFSTLEVSARRQLIFHFFGMWASFFLLILGWFLVA